jgi:hypothetical protein
MGVSLVSSESAQKSDHFDTRIGVLTICSSIVTSRKRKLRELYAIATAPDGVPNLDLTIADVPPTTQGERDFLEASELLLYVENIF